LFSRKKYVLENPATKTNKQKGVEFHEKREGKIYSEFK